MNSTKTENILSMVHKCNDELGFKVLHETIFNMDEKTFIPGIRSYVIKNKYLSEMKTLVNIDKKELEIQMNFKQEIKQDSHDRVLSTLDSFNSSNKDFEWRTIPCLRKLQYSTIIKIDDSKKNNLLETKYKRILKKLVEQGIDQYDYFMNISQNKDTLIN
jgi:hypothetical protein